MSWPLEPAARTDRGHADTVRTEPPREQEIELSKAISLKRIADALGGGLDLSNIGAQIETIAWNSGRAFESGRRQS